jgi:1,4-alpha-glucan branching enzyme
MDGMGALVHEGGVAFRVWAPHADAVHVVGDFNEWRGDATPMASEGNGNWYADVPGAVAGQEYKYLIRNGDAELHRIDPQARQVTNSVGNGVIYDPAAFDWQGDAFTITNHNELVIYELHIGSFAPRSDGGTGTLGLALERLDHLEQLGVNVIQVMPVAEFAGDLSWGYNPAHVFAVESSYGGPDALKEFIRQAHTRGMAVILDVVYNHFGPSDLDLWQFDGWSENGKGGIYFFNDHRSVTPWGDTRPDYGRGEVRQFIHDNALMWLREYHLDGLRYDMTPYIRSISASGDDIPEGWSLLRWVNESIRTEFPGKILIAEDMHQDPRITQTGEDGAAFHAQWDSSFVHPVREAVITPDDANRSMREVIHAVTMRYNDNAFHRVVYTESHDEVANGRARVPYEIDEGDSTGWYAQKRSTVGAALALTSPGIPMIFQGQEFLEGGWFRDDVPLDWAQNEEFHGVVRLYRDLVTLRRNASGLTKGLTGHQTEVLHADEERNTLAYHRWAEGGPHDSTVVMVNLSHEALEGMPVRMPATGRWVLRLNSDARIYSDIFGDGDAFDLEAVEESGFGIFATVAIPAYSVLVYSQD